MIFFYLLGLFVAVFFWGFLLGDLKGQGAPSPERSALFFGTLAVLAWPALLVGLVFLFWNQERTNALARRKPKATP